MGYNEGAAKLQENKRTATINEVIRTIDFIKQIEGENTPITAKKILDNCSLSRAVLYKEHVLKIWNNKLWAEKYDSNVFNTISLKAHHKENHKLLEQLSALDEQLNNQITINQKLQLELERANKRIEFYKIEFEDINKQNQILLHECQRLNDKLNMHGII